MLIKLGHFNWLRLGFTNIAPKSVADDNGFGRVVFADIDGDDVGHPVLHVFFAKGAATKAADTARRLVTVKALHG